MKTYIKKKTTITKNDNLILLCNSNTKLSDYTFSNAELDYIVKKQKNNTEIIEINQYTRKVFIVVLKKEKNSHKHYEKCRMIGDRLAGKLKNQTSISIIVHKKSQEETMLIAEGIALSNYTFLKHKNNAPANKLKTIFLCGTSDQKQINELVRITY